jgi:uncharacterized protein YjbI with pentapeptide repeats
MASKEHLEILAKGVKAWNKWREGHPRLMPNLRKANLLRANLRAIDLSGVNLIDANLESADLIDAHLCGAVLIGANLDSTNLARSHFTSADLAHARIRDSNIALADFTYVNLSGAIMHRANLNSVDLSYANLSGAELGRVVFNEVDFREANFTKAIFENTVFADCDLTAAKGLNKIKHFGPSSIDIQTLNYFEGAIPEQFLRRAGLPEDFVVYASSLTKQAIEFYSCFISYSSKDQAFAQRLYADIQNQNIRCWFAPEDLKIGDKIRSGIDESIRRYDKLLLVLSKHSVQSEWVEKEVETAFELERKQKRVILFPIRLDNTVMKIDTGWPADIRKTRNIGDFVKWKDYDAYEKAFERLLRDLKSE